MGFAIPRVKKTPEPKYKNTIVCSGCHAEYDPAAKFCVTRNMNDVSPTANRRAYAYSLPKNHCPVCGRENIIHGPEKPKYTKLTQRQVNKRIKNNRNKK